MSECWGYTLSAWTFFMFFNAKSFLDSLHKECNRKNGIGPASGLKAQETLEKKKKWWCGKRNTITFNIHEAAACVEVLGETELVLQYCRSHGTDPASQSCNMMSYRFPGTMISIFFTNSFKQPCLKSILNATVLKYLEDICASSYLALLQTGYGFHI